MKTIPDSEQARIRKWAEKMDHDVTLRYATADHPMDDTFKAFANQLTELAPCVHLKKDGDALVRLPALFVGPHKTYQALPLNRELEPFLTALGDASAFADQLAKGVREQLDRLEVPAMTKVYITPHCPFCPTVVSLLLGLAAASDRVRLSIIDGELFPDEAQKDRVSAAPTIILDDQFRWTGSVDANELVTMMLDRDPAGLGADALQGLIEDGDAQGVAQMMADNGTLFPAFFKLLTHPRWSVRLGAMVTFETLVELDPQLAAQVVDPIISCFGDVDDMVKGDLLHVVGESGNPAAMPFLKSVASDAEDEEVRDAAIEAIEKLN
ncbi:putative electron carrier protein related to thioredoxin [Desulfosarcina variabilis str. Montpellier]|uniref:HEAT repeat domain-containing protein n=1 Tax=Desulfosarcina variabilis TaxID=2300 RepID=UPI003AFA593F